MIETQADVEQWLEAHRPDLAAYEDGDRKGVYVRNVGPAMSFHVLGWTWEEVAEVLGANDA